MNATFIKSPIVKLKYINPNYAEIIEWAGRQSTGTNSRGNPEKFVRDRVREGHLSLGRFSIAMFEIHCSRNCSLQLLRHKFIDYCQQSQRYTRQEPAFMLPPSIAADETLSEKYKEGCIKSYEEYTELKESGILKEDARFLLPSASITSLAMCLNFQAARDMLLLRLDKAAQWEIRTIAFKIGKILLKEANAFFGDLEDVIKHSGKELDLI